MARPDLEFYFHVLETLEQLEVPYVIIGAFAGVTYGVTRATYDVDIVVDLDESQIEGLAEAYPPPRYYADPFQMRDSIRMGILFNIIDSSLSRKVDLIPLTMEPGYGFALRNRIRRSFPASEEAISEAWFAKPEDVIVGKLMAWQEGRSFKHESDIRDMLLAIKYGDDPDLSGSFETSYIDRWVSRIGEEASDLWHSLKEVTEIT
jgi:hypothetical protein